MPYGTTLDRDEMVERRRTRVLNVRLQEAEVEMLSELAELEGMSVSEWIRTIIRQKHTLAFGGRTTPVKKRKR